MMLPNRYVGGSISKSVGGDTYLQLNACIFFGIHLKLGVVTEMRIS